LNLRVPARMCLWAMVPSIMMLTCAPVVQLLDEDVATTDVMAMAPLVVFQLCGGVGRNPNKRETAVTTTTTTRRQGQLVGCSLTFGVPRHKQTRAQTHEKGRGTPDMLGADGSGATTEPRSAAVGME